MGKIAALLLVLVFLIASVAEAQVEPPQPPNVDTLGPPVFYNQYESTSVVMILTPKNSSSCVNPVQLSFTVAADGVFGQFGHVGVSVDGGVINSVTDFTSKYVEPSGPEWYWYRTTVKASVMLPTFSEGTHNATVYYGWQYQDRYEVSAQGTVQFNIDESPPTISRLSISNNTYNLKDLPLSFIVDENTSWVAYNLDNQGNVTVQGNVTLAGLSEGSHSIVVYANDTLGNMGESDTVFFTIDTLKTPAEFFTLAIVLISTTLIVVVIGLFVYFKKRIHAGINKHSEIDQPST